MLQSGQFFGEMALVDPASKRRAASVVALLFTDLYKLGAKDFDRISKLFPQFREDIDRAVRERANQNRNISKLTKRGSERGEAGSLGGDAGGVGGMKKAGSGQGAGLRAGGMRVGPLPFSPQPPRPGMGLGKGPSRRASFGSSGGGAGAGGGGANGGGGGNGSGGTTMRERRSSSGIELAQARKQSWHQVMNEVDTASISQYLDSPQSARGAGKSPHGAGGGGPRPT